jgi:hypothetical protein
MMIEKPSVFINHSRGQSTSIGEIAHEFIKHGMETNLAEMYLGDEFGGPRSALGCLPGDATGGSAG